MMAKVAASAKEITDFGLDSCLGAVAKWDGLGPKYWETLAVAFGVPSQQLQGASPRILAAVDSEELKEALADWEPVPDQKPTLYLKGEVDSRTKSSATMILYVHVLPTSCSVSRHHTEWYGVFAKQKAMGRRVTG